MEEPMRKIVALLSALTVAATCAGTAAAQSTKIESAGPLTRVEITTDLNCAVSHIADTDPEFFSDTACGTLVAVGTALFGPANIPAGGGATPRTAFTPVTQSAVTGTGTPANPYRIVTVVSLGETGLQLTETDSYVVGEEAYRTDVTISNTGAAPQSVIVYRAGDCYLQNSDDGFGRVDGAAVACRGVQDPDAATPAPGNRIEQWIPLTAGSSYYEASYNQVWSHIGSRLPFPNTCRCDEYIDNGAGLSWTVVVPAGGAVTLSHLTNFSPTGRLALAAVKTADSAATPAGGQNGYTITISNPNASAVTLNSITDTLPQGFSYRPGTTTGATTANPTVSGRTLTWSGPIAVPANGSASLHFGVTVSTTPGDYLNSATADATPFAVAPTGETARITVLPAVEADVRITKLDSPDPVSIGQNVTYTLTVSNAGPASATGVTVTDSLPAAVAFVSVNASQGTCTGTATVACSLGTIPNGGSATVTVVARAVQVGSASNTATVQAAEPDPVTGNNSASTTTVVLAAADVALAKASSAATARVGDTFTYTLTTTNAGPSPASGVVVTDTLPSGIELVSASASQGSCAGAATVTCAIGTLASGSSATVTIVARATAPGTITNTAQVSATEQDPASGNNSASATTTVEPAPVLPPPRCRLTITPNKLVAGRAVLVRVAVSNLGTRTPAANTTVRLRGPGIRAERATGRSGFARFRVLPARAGTLRVRVPAFRDCAASLRIARQGVGAGLTGRL
jgi:uncharacterized repeat protein (TIGR01451 family)